MYRISERSEWRNARRQIKESLIIGTDLNNTVPPSAVITKVNTDGFIVNIGGLREIELKWSLVECCWKDLCNEGFFNENIFSNPYEKAFLDSNCLCFLIRRLLTKSGLLSYDEKEQMKLKL